MGSARRRYTTDRLIAIAAVLVAAIGGSQSVFAAEAAEADAAEDAIPYSRRGADTCLGCHDDGKSLTIFMTKHGQRGDARTPFGAGGLQCESCHGPGGDHSKRPRRGEERASMPPLGS